MPCETHSCVVTDRGGRSRLLEISPLESIDWERLQDDVSLANLTVITSQCKNDLSVIEAGRHELVIYRGSDRVWEGPITLVRHFRDRVEIQARDVMHYAYRTIMRSAYSNRYPNTSTCIDRSVRIITTELNRMWERLDPPINVVPYLTPIRRTDDSRTSRVTRAYERTVFNDIDDLARTAGMDYTVIGRRIILHDTDTALGRMPTLTENDIAGDIIITQYGMEVASFAAVTGAEGQLGSAEGPNGYPDPYYGAWEILDDAYDEEEGTDQPTQAELDSQARRNISNRIPTPVELRVPDGSTLVPTSPLMDLDLMVPGVQIPVLATFPSRTITQMHKLRRAKFSEDENGETVQITLLPTRSTLDEGGEG